MLSDANKEDGILITNSIIVKILPIIVNNSRCLLADKYGYYLLQTTALRPKSTRRHSTSPGSPQNSRQTPARISGRSARVTRRNQQQTRRQNPTPALS